MKKILLIVWLAVGTASTIALVVMALRPTGFWEDVKAAARRWEEEQRTRYKEVPLDKPPVFTSFVDPLRMTRLEDALVERALGKEADRDKPIQLTRSLQEAVAGCHSDYALVRIVSLKLDLEHSRPANGIFFYDGEAIMEDYDGKSVKRFTLAYREGEELLARYGLSDHERRDQLVVWGQKAD